MGSALMMLMGNLDVSWASMKKFLASTGMISSVINFDAHNINASRRKEVQEYIHSKPKSFDQAHIRGISAAAAPLAAWAVAILEYSIVL